MLLIKQGKYSSKYYFHTQKVIHIFLVQKRYWIGAKKHSHTILTQPNEAKLSRAIGESALAPKEHSKNILQLQFGE